VKKTPLRKNPYLLWGTVFLTGMFFLLYYATDRILMPNFTRQAETIRVPDFRGKSISNALTEIISAELVLGDTTSRIGPKDLQGLVASQSPRPNASVKVGRRIYLTLYRGSAPDVAIPDVTEESLRNARLTLTAVGLVVRYERPDTIPSPFPDMVTRILPGAGTLVPRGDSVTVWYGLGLNQTRLVEVPDVVGLRYEDAEGMLRPLFFWPTLLGLTEDSENPLIMRQSPGPGEMLPAGSTLRLFATADSLGQP